MTDIERFAEFFALMGVVVEGPDATEKSDYVAEEIPEQATRTLTVAQAIFFFASDGAYLGVLSDEMMDWYPRKT